MPLGRYFGFVGGLLLVLLFVADWYFPSVVSGKEAGGVDKTVVRIASAHRWPDLIVFDTNQPTIVPPPNVVLAEIPASNSPREAFAQLAGPSAKLIIPEIVRRKSKAAKRHSFTKVAAAHPAEAVPLPAGW
jgi:hypothetical protein